MKKLLVVLLVLCFAAPVVAADWHFYGSLRTHLGYYDVDQEYIGGPAMDGTIGDFGVDDDSGTLLGLGAQSRFGVKAIASENLYGVIELGFRDSTRDNADNDDDYLRLAYGVWNFGAGKLTVGKDYTPGTFLGYSRMGADIGDSGDANMLLGGLSYISRQSQIKLSFGDLDIALIEQNKDAFDYGGDMDFYLPRIEAAYVFRTDLVNIRPVVGFQTYEVDGGPNDGEDIDSYLVGLGASFDLKPAYIKATCTYLQNAGNYGQLNVGLVSVLNGITPEGSILNARVVNGSVEDSELLQGTFVAGVQVNEMLNLEAGFGYMSGEVDIAQGVTAEQTAYLYYLQAWLSMAKGMHIIPEIGMLDRGDLEIDGMDDTDSGKLTYFDVNFRVDF